MNSTQKNMNPNHDKQKMAPVVAGAVGAVVGATAAWLSDSANRQKVSQVLEEAVNRAREGADDAKKIAADALKDIEGQAKKMGDKGKKISKEKVAEARDVADAVESTVSRATKNTEEKVKEIS
jgi:hypothetical protein